MAARRCLMQMLVLAVLLAPAGLANGAGNDSDETAGSGYTHILDTLHALRRELESKRRVVIREAMQFDAAQAKVFWPLYDRYREDTGKLDDRRDRLLTHYLAALDSMTDARADALMRDNLASTATDCSCENAIIAASSGCCRHGAWCAFSSSTVSSTWR